MESRALPAIRGLPERAFTYTRGVAADVRTRRLAT